MELPDEPENDPAPPEHGEEETPVSDYEGLDNAKE